MTLSRKLKLAFIAIIASLIAGCSDGSYRSFKTATYDHWDRQEQFRTRDRLFQNVRQEDLVTLLSGKTFVGYEETGGRGAGYGALSVRYFGADGSVPMCMLNYETGKPRYDAFGVKKWISTVGVNPYFGVEINELEMTNPDGASGYSPVQYNPTRGAIAFPGYFKPYFWDLSKGHLQNGIPAAVYTACPEFPSAESLGTFVNHKQTSWNYFELLQQDAGDRVIRPDLVTEGPPVQLAPEVAAQ